MESYQIIHCAKCQQKLRLPSNRGLLNVECPNCGNSFFWERDKGIVAGTLQKKKSPLPKLIAFSLVLVGIFALIIYYNQTIITSFLIPSKEPKWITVSYSNLLDPKSIIRTGQSLKSALNDPQLRGAVQPFVDSYSYLLQHALDMTSEPEKVPHNNIIDAYPLGSAQPAWASILRGGRIHITTDYKNHVNAFILGNDPKKAYHDNYSLIRHCLNALLSPKDSPLTVKVFAYKNDYAKSELRLNIGPYVVSASSFPSKGNELDLSGLAAFFSESPEIQGAQLDNTKGLILYGQLGEKQTLAGKSLSLSDFAAAYRAVFHAGDNEAFVSLDPNKDPTKVTVNFGGYLENTRIGSVVLEADKRFKTITSGLDPNNFKDMRRHTRQHVASFLSVGEQDLLTPRTLSQGKWIGTRFWFYPDSVGIESDLNYEYAMITNPIFMADAERSKDDFELPEEFQRKKNTTLSPSIRRNIDHLNQHYDQYASAFGELKELTTVARLMGLCSWLYKANSRSHDLDVLLSVEIPSFLTPKERTQMVAACFISYPSSETVTTKYLINNSKVVYLGPILDKKVSEYFLNSTNFAKYLCVKNGSKTDKYKIYESKAMQLFKAYQNRKVRDIIKTKEEMKALASYSAETLDVQDPPIITNLERTINSEEKELKRLNNQIKKVRRTIDSTTNNYKYNTLINKHNQLVKRYETRRDRYNQAVDRYNSLSIERPYGIEIGGGINLEPRNFKIKSSPNSIKLSNFRKKMSKVSTEWSSIDGTEKWIKNRTGGKAMEVKKVPRIEWGPIKETASNNFAYKYVQGGSDHQYWSMVEAQSGSWRDSRKLHGGWYQVRSYEAEIKKMQIAEFDSGKLNSYIIGQLDDSGRIVFRKSERQDVLKPQEPPIWFVGN